MEVEEEMAVPMIDIGVESAATMLNDDNGGGGVDGGGLKPNGMKSAMSVALSNKNALSTNGVNRTAR